VALYDGAPFSLVNKSGWIAKRKTENIVNAMTAKRIDFMGIGL